MLASLKVSKVQKKEKKIMSSAKEEGQPQGMR